MTYKQLAAAAAFTLASLGSAHAALAISGSVGGAPSASGVVYDNLDWLPLGTAGGVSPDSGITVNITPNAAAVTGSSSGRYAAPFLSGGNGAGFGNGDGADATTYLTTGSTGAVAGAAIELLLGADYRYFGLLWGSVDAYNTLAFYDGANLVGTVTGSNVTASPNGNQGVNGTLYVNILSDLSFNRVVATSSQYAFEFDNIALSRSNPVPEPHALALLGLGLVGVAAARRRQRRTA